jgi:hypothetical protein
MDLATDPLEERFKDIERKKATHQTVDSLFAILVISIQSDSAMSRKMYTYLGDRLSKALALLLYAVRSSDPSGYLDPRPRNPSAANLILYGVP